MLQRNITLFTTISFSLPSNLLAYISNTFGVTVRFAWVQSEAKSENYICLVSDSTNHGCFMTINLYCKKNNQIGWDDISLDVMNENIYL